MRKPHFPQLLRLPVMGALVAATATALASGPAAAGTGFGPHIGTPHSNSSNWGGYVVSGAKGKFKTITGSWKEPVAKCTKKGELAAPWIGLDGWGDQTVEQTGVAAYCHGGAKPEYLAWYEMYPRNPVYYSNKVSAGDTFTASVTFKGGTSYKLVLHDVTKHWTQTRTQKLSARNASAEAVIEGPGGYPQFPNGVTFKNIKVNGHLFSYYHPRKLTSSGFVPGPLHGGTFTIKHR